MDLDQLIEFYKQQIKKFKRIGIGNRTKFNTEVSQKMIDSSQKRLDELIERREKGTTKLA